MKNWRFYVLIFFILFCFGVIIFRLFSLQILQHSFYESKAAEQQETLQTVYPKRGEIYMQDRFSDGKSQTSLFPIAINKDFFKIWAKPIEIEEKEETVEKLAPFLTLDKEILKERIFKENDPYEPLEDKVNEELANKIKDLKIKGIYFETETRRYLPANEFACHVLGFVGQSNNEKLGQYGVEEYYEKQLAGKTGLAKMEKDSKGRLISISKEIIQKTEDGADIILTIDPNIQSFVEAKLKSTIERLSAPKGSIILMEAKTGAIKAMTNWPKFNPNEYNKVKNANVFSNQAVHDLFEPGSIFKPITMAAALDTGAVTPQTTYEDKGKVQIGSKIIENAVKTPQGIQTMTQVLEKSLNTGAIFAMQKTGKEKFKEYVEKFGFNDKTGIDLPGEVKGNTANLETNRDIEYATATFGQGIAITSIQLISALGAIANDGILLRPYIVDKIIYRDGKEEITKKQEIRRVISSETASRLTAMMVSVVENGFSKKAKVPGYLFAGKTGTAQIPDFKKGGYTEETIHTFGEFFPAYDTRWVLLIKVDEPKGIRFASDSLTPVAREIAQYILNYYEIPPSE
jgi:cell division protein FtsI/penicillin-binding protein 2